MKLCAKDFLIYCWIGSIWVLLSHLKVCFFEPGVGTPLVLLPNTCLQSGPLVGDPWLLAPCSLSSLPKSLNYHLFQPASQLATVVPVYILSSDPTVSFFEAWHLVLSSYEVCSHNLQYVELYKLKHLCILSYRTGVSSSASPTHEYWQSKAFKSLEFSFPVATSLNV